ncbi:MAG: aromatic ring-hydroxylating dioxygenase subunit alpha [Roseibium sp.]|uniref:aromatic ring-hydroxylating oxygenase subunit alpha n=1 Tax=Roseibium sp. TaxID=1936156 RepID=UPI002626D928|nr:aromatic ring-hydroxylating dioxygenase subunit alpha [Roseibium sp.]MCV0424894.1 aromatic ring-hydroxylating dioxygenase subunit alpha [Roseibium sp.]
MTSIHRLGRDAYVGQHWFLRETTELFRHAWCFVGTTRDFKEPGDYKTLDAGAFPLAVVRNRDGVLRAVHNFCRHRGATLFDGEAGNIGKSIVCPYHRWTYGLDGELRGVPDKETCFPDLDRSKLGLRTASLGVFKELVFANPDPSADFDDWITPVVDQAWPHDLFAADVREACSLTYEVKCNWKVFVENAIDGYHLAYLHEQTLGGPSPDKNIWKQAGDHMIWYANEDGVRHRLPKKIRDENGSVGTIKSAERTGYGGVYFLFPQTLIVPTPYGLSLTSVKPMTPNTSRLAIRHWVGPWQALDERKHIPGYDRKTGIISSDNWTQHPLETGDFQTEDVWICEKVQRGLNSPAFEAGPLSRGVGAEDPINWFHHSLLTKLQKQD